MPTQLSFLTRIGITPSPSMIQKESWLIGFDNAHPVPHTGGRYVKATAESDHWHRTINDEGRPYTFVSVEQLLEDYFLEVERICKEQGISTEVVNEKET